MLLTPRQSSWPWAVLDPVGGLRTPALLKRTWSLVSLERNSVTVALMVVRSARSSFKKIKEPVELGTASLIDWMAERALSSDRAAM